MKIILLLLCGIISAHSFGQVNNFTELTNITKLIAERHFNHYAKLDIDSMAMEMADHINVEDPTARIIFQAQKIAGKDKVLESFKKTFTIFNVSIPTSRRYFSGNYGIFEGVYKYSSYTKNKDVISFELPITIIIKVENSKVVERKDFVDYDTFLSQLQMETARIKEKQQKSGNK